MIKIKTPEEIARMRVAGQMVAKVRDAVAGKIAPGVTTKELDDYARDLIREMGGIGTFYGYHGYPAHLCISINEEVVHGIPGKRIIQDGDIVSVDQGVTYDGFVARYDYVDTLYAGVGKAAKDGKELASMFSEYDMQSRFPELAGTPGFTESFVHNGSLLALWSDWTGAESARSALETAIEEKGAKAAVAELTAARAKGSDKYYFLEVEFNQLGYRYLGEEKYEEAIAVFAMNVDMYPESWNVYDSLGEAYMKSGQHDLAVLNYEKSLELNPENENGKRMLDEIHTALAKK